MNKMNKWFTHNFNTNVMKVVFTYFHILILSVAFMLPSQTVASNTEGPASERSRHSVRVALKKAAETKKTNHTKAIEGANTALRIAQEEGYAKEKAKAHFLICSIYYGSMQYDSLLYHCNQSLTYFEQEGDLDTVAWLYDYKGIILDRIGKHEEAEQSFNKGLSIFRQTGNKKGEGYIINDLGVLYNYTDEYSKALEYYYQALAIFENEKMEDGLMRSYSCLGYFFRKQGQYDKALEYFQKSLDIARYNEEHHWELMIMRGMVRIYRKQDNNELAIQYLEQIIEKAESAGNSSELTDAYYNLARNKYRAGDLKSAEEIALKALSISEQMKQKKFRPSLLRLLAEVNLDNNNIREAKKYLQLTTDANSCLKSRKSRANTYKLWVKYYTKIDQPKHALSYSLKYCDLRDSIDSVEKIKSIGKIHKGFELGKKEAEIALLSQANKEQKEHLALQSNLSKSLGALVLLSVLLLLVLYKLYKTNKQMNNSLEEKIAQRTTDLMSTNKKLKQSNEELNRFAHVASHDMKEPVRNIVGFLQLVERKLKRNDYDEVDQFISISKNSAVQLHKLIEDVLEFSKTGKVPANSKSDLNEVILGVRSNLKQAISEKNAVINVSALPMVNAMEVDVKRLFQNLIANAIKFNKSDQPVIDITFTEAIDRAIFKVSDNGIGINTKYQKNIFQMFTRLHNRRDFDGTGLGLSICKKIVEKYDGSISVHSIEGEGSTFTFSLPLYHENKVLEPVMAG